MTFLASMDWFWVKILPPGGGALRVSDSKSVNNSQAFQNSDQIPALDAKKLANFFDSGDFSFKKGEIRLRSDSVKTSQIARHAIESYQIDSNSVTSRTIRNGTILDKDISVLAGIAFSKLNIQANDLGISQVANLQDYLDEKLNLSGGTLSGNLNLGGFDILNGGTITASGFVGNISGSSSNVTGTVDTAHGGTGLSSFSQGDLLYYTSGTSLSKLSKSTTANQFIKNSGTDNAPAWATIANTDISGLGSIATQNSNNVSLTGGSLTGTYANSNSPLAFTFGSATGSNNLFSLSDTASNTGTGYLLNITTGSSSLLKPFSVSASDGTFPAISVNSSGQVGLGTETPYSQLSVVGGATFGATYSLETLADGNVAIETSLGIGTTSPASALEVRSDTDTQLTLSYDASNSLTLQVDASGNVSLSATGESFTFDQKVVADDFEKTCPTGFVWVPGSAKFGTLPGFCMMKYEAKCDDDADGEGDTTAEDATYKTWRNDTSACTTANNRAVVSSASGAPIAYISQETARSYCQNLGDGYHLISEAEWMTVAENIANLPINDTDADAGLQLGNGQSDNSPAYALSATAEADPTVTGCDLNENMEDAGNDYVAGSCEIQGDGSYGGDDSDKGYYGTSNQWSTSGYVSGASNKSQMRSHVLSNRNVVWDMSGNVWEWVDALITQNEQPTDGSEVGVGTGEWIEWNIAGKLQSSVSRSRPPLDDWTGTNGIGTLYTYGQDETATTMRAFRRGGSWYHASYAGVFALNLGDAPTNTYNGIGFRCSR